MNSEARGNSGFSQDVSFPNNDIKPFPRNNNSSRFQSPLLQASGFVKTERASFAKPYGNSNPSQFNNRPHLNNPSQNRPGWKSMPHTNEFNQSNGRNGTFNRKRTRDPSNGPIPQKQWRGRRPNFQQNNDQHINMAQFRLDRIRSNTRLNEIIPKNTPFVEPENTPFVEPYPLDQPPEINNDSQELDATDITVQVVNSSAQPKDDSITRFKMILDPKAQASIRTIQQKRKDKQVIFPFPVTPNVTGLSIHERFTML